MDLRTGNFSGKYPFKGRYLYDVRTEGGRGVTQYVTNTTDRLRECVTKGGEGVQNPENFADVI